MNCKFANALHPKLGKTTENSFYSPFSLLSALGMCTEGAKKKTLKELSSLLGCPVESDERRSFFKEMVANVKGTTLKGKVIREQYAKGSKSEHNAVMLETTDGQKYKLRFAGGNPFNDPALDKLVGQDIERSGTIAGNLFIMKPDNACELTTANALWLHKTSKFLPDYAKTVKENYGGETHIVDYEGDKKVVVDAINNWCNENTRTRIPEIINEDFIQKDMLLILTNAIYFKGKWQTQFKKENTKDADFVLSSNKKVKVPTMNLSSGFSYAENDSFQALDLPYQGGDLSMLVVLPKEKDTAQLDTTLEETYNDAVNNLRFEETVVTSLPRFKLETKYKLVEKFKELGCKLPFSDAADFTGIIEGEEIKISEVIHKAFVQCDEEGTEAAAVTAVGMVRCTSVRIPQPPKVFNANHPFLFFIRNRNTNEILFNGRVADPSKGN